jgi:phosphoribosyl 1,2-cyclic phosphodiesterase
MKIRFWGVRGSCAVSGAPYTKTGGNTSCVEVEHDGYRLILDGGTGLRGLGDLLGAPLEATLLFSHVHWDHIQGLPFFTPAYHPGSNLTVIGVDHGEGELAKALQAQMQPPTFPVGLELLQGIREFKTVSPTASFEAGPFKVSVTEQTHPNGCAAFRIEAGGRCVVYATDVEHGCGMGIDPNLVRLSLHADLLIHDAQYLQEEYAGTAGPSRKGWGHSTWNEAVQAARLSGADRLALFHHDPGRDDAGVNAIESAARQRFAGAFAAREGQEVVL